MRKGSYILIISILIVGIFTLLPFILKFEFPNRIYFASVLFFTIGFLFSLILILVFLIPFGILSQKNRYPVEHLEQMSSIFIQAQREMKEMNERLDKELKTRTHQLETMGSALLSTQIELLQKEKLASLAQMASGVVHQIRNPLAIIKNAAYLLRKKTGDNEYLNDNIKIVEDEVDRMNNIAEELLRFARTGERMALEPVNIKDIIQEILKEMAITEPNYSKIKVVNDISDSLSKVQGERESLKQALLNIISNAYQAMPKSGTLKLKSDENDKNVQLTISDTGVGIPSKEKGLIFEPFFTTKDKKGSGLGLAISYAIIKKIGGDIKVDSKEGEGTTFNVFLKVQESM